MLGYGIPATRTCTILEMLKSFTKHFTGLNSLPSVDLKINIRNWISQHLRNLHVAFW